MYPGIPKDLAEDIRLLLTREAIFDFYSSCLAANEYQLAYDISSSVSDLIAIGFVNFPRSEIVEERLQQHHEDPYGMAVPINGETPLWGHYLVLGRSATGLLDNAASADLELTAETIGVALGEGAVAERHFRGLYARNGEGSNGFEVVQTALKRSLPLKGKWGDLDGLVSIGSYSDGLFKLDRQAAILIRLARSENDKTIQFIILWTAFEYQLKVFPGTQSGDRRKKFTAELGTPGIDERVYDLFKKRSAILKGKGLEVEIEDLMLLKRLIRILAARGSRVYKELASTALTLEAKSYWIKLIS